MTAIILRVAVFSPLRRLFDYLPPDNTEQNALQIGVRVLVPFHRQKRIGIIIAVADQSDFPLEKLKQIESLLDPKPLLSKNHLALLLWTGNYYQSPLGEVFEAALPTRLRKVSALSVQHRKPKAELRKEAVITPKPQLNEKQQLAVQTILAATNSFETFLLHGITGSGKTEVYSCLIEKMLESKKQTLVLVPEIGLTPQLLSRFEQRFSVPIIVMNSSLTESQRYTAWEKARTGEASIIVGTRSAVFAPLKNPGLFIIDEEHDPSFKQQDGFRYHARDLLIKRASIEKCPIVLGTATPALETLHNANNLRFTPLSLPNRAGEATLPSVKILDVRHKKLAEGLSNELIATMQTHLEAKGQVLLFLNRRGFAPVFMCLDCNWMANCKNCDSHLTVHYQSKTLKCHHCEIIIPLEQQCPSCLKKNLKPIGLGTERLEHFLSDHFPDYTTVRIDRDTTRKKQALEATLKQIHQGKADILLGTQMIAKGHHFPNVTLVAIIDIDQALFSSDFRSFERMGQLITQVSGRTGRADRPGHVLLQTSHPEHPSLKRIIHHGYLDFAASLLNERKTINLPPYSHQVLFRAESTKLERALNFLHAIKQTLREKDVALLGPVPAPMEKRQGKHRAQLLLQSNKRSLLHNSIKALLPQLDSTPLANSVRWSIDVDPIDLY